MASGEDSGLESMTGSTTKDDMTSETVPIRICSHGDDDLDDEDLDETLAERLMGLTEMFPERIRAASCTLLNGLHQGLKGLYTLGRTSSWIFFSTSAILFAPVIFEVERAQMEEMQKQQQRQILLGPNAALSGGGSTSGMPTAHML